MKENLKINGFNGEVVINELDMDVLEFARKISMLSIDTPLANKFDAEHGQKRNRWWSCQREHLTVWCLHYPKEGVKGFLHKPNNSAADMYNRFGRPETLLWLIEAIMKNYNDDFDLKGLIKEIKEVNNARSACAKIREKMPFKKIKKLLLN